MPIFLQSQTEIEYEPLISEFLGTDIVNIWPWGLLAFFIIEFVCAFLLAPANKAMLKKLGYNVKCGLPVYTSSVLFKHFWQQRHYWFFDFTMCLTGYICSVAMIFCFDFRYIDLLFPLLVIMPISRICVNISLIKRIGKAFCKETSYICGMIFHPLKYYTNLAIGEEQPLFISNYDEQYKNE